MCLFYSHIKGFANLFRSESYLQSIKLIDQFHYGIFKRFTVSQPNNLCHVTEHTIYTGKKIFLKIKGFEIELDFQSLDFLI